MFRPFHVSTFLGNLTALAEFQPAVAALVDSTLIPSGVTVATGRDGKLTLRVPTEDGRVAWFGLSSMPTISAAEVLSGFHSEGNNVSLPGVATGVELRIVAEKLPAHCALFVAEDDPLSIKLAMHLHDYTDLITTGRVVFLPGPDLAKSVPRFFERHPGYLLPGNLLTMPQRSAAQIADLRRRLESGCSGAAAAQAGIVDSLQQRIAKRTVRVLPSKPRVAVLSIDARPFSLEQTRRIDRALAKLGWPHELCVPDAPGRCHVAARLQAIEHITADLVLLVNGGPGSVASLLPSELPVANWYLPGVSVSHIGKNEPANPPLSSGERGADRALFFASTRAHRDELSAAGVPPEAIELCPIAADDTLYHRTETDPPLAREGVPPLSPLAKGGVAAGQQSVTSKEMAVVMDLPDSFAEACGITLPSHVALWQALHDLLGDLIDRTSHHAGGVSAQPSAGAVASLPRAARLVQDLLETAQRKSGTTLQDEHIRDRFTALIQARMVPVAVARSTVEALRRVGCPVSLWGANWRQVLQQGESWGGSVPMGSELNELFKRVAVVVLPDSGPVFMQLALDAMVACVPVICRTSQSGFERDYPGLADLSPYLHFYDTSSELAQIARSLKSGSGVEAKNALAASEAIRNRHTVAHRLSTIVEAVRGRAASRLAVS